MLCSKREMFNQNSREGHMLHPSSPQNTAHDPADVAFAWEFLIWQKEEISNFMGSNHISLHFNYTKSYFCLGPTHFCLLTLPLFATQRQSIALVPSDNFPCSEQCLHLSVVFFSPAFSPWDFHPTSYMYPAFCSLPHSSLPPLFLDQSNIAARCRETMGYNINGYLLKVYATESSNLTMAYNNVFNIMKRSQ